MLNNSNYSNNQLHQSIIQYLGIKSNDSNHHLQSQAKEFYLKKIQRYPPHLFPQKFYQLDLCKEWIECGPIFLESLFFHTFKNFEDYLFFLNHQQLENSENLTFIIHDSEETYQYEQCFYFFTKNYIQDLKQDIG